MLDLLKLRCLFWAPWTGATVTDVLIISKEALRLCLLCSTSNFWPKPSCMNQSFLNLKPVWCHSPAKAVIWKWGSSSSTRLLGGEHYFHWRPVLTFTASQKKKEIICKVAHNRVKLAALRQNGKPTICGVRHLKTFWTTRNVQKKQNKFQLWCRQRQRNEQNESCRVALARATKI